MYICMCVSANLVKLLTSTYDDITCNVPHQADKQRIIINSRCNRKLHKSTEQLQILSGKFIL